MKKFIPSMLNRKRVIPVIKITFPNSGIALNSAFTANFKASFLLIIRNGLNALNALIALILFKAYYPPKAKFIIAVITTTKSNLFHPTLI